MSEQQIRSAFEVYGAGWALVDALTMREDVRCGLFCSDPEHREARSDRFVLLVAWGMLVSALIDRHFLGLRQGELCLGQLAEVVDSGRKIHGNGKESAAYLRAALGDLAEKAWDIPAHRDDIWAGYTTRYVRVEGQAATCATPGVHPASPVVGIGGGAAHSFAAPGASRWARGVPGAGEDDDAL